MLLAAVGHTAVHVADWGEVVLVVAAAVVDVDDEDDGVEGLLLHAAAPTESAPSSAATPRRRFVIIPSCLQVPNLGRAEGPVNGHRSPCCAAQDPAAEGHER